MYMRISAGAPACIKSNQQCVGVIKSNQPCSSQSHSAEKVVNLQQEGSDSVVGGGNSTGCTEKKLMFLLISTTKY